MTEVCAPPADAVSSARPRRAPNWACKTWMAATGVCLAVVVLAALIANLVLFISLVELRHVVESGTANYSWVSRPIWPTPALLWTVGLVTAALALTHGVIAVVLWRRCRAARGPVKARLSGLHQWWTASMPVTGAIAALCVLSAVIWRFHFEIVWALPDCLPGPDCHTTVDLGVVGAAPWAVYAVYVVAVLAAGLHAAHGLATVATIAAGAGAFAGRVRHWLIVVGGPLLALLVVASVFTPLAFWLRWV